MQLPTWNHRDQPLLEKLVPPPSRAPKRTLQETGPLPEEKRARKEEDKDVRGPADGDDPSVGTGAGGRDDAELGGASIGAGERAAETRPRVVAPKARTQDTWRVPRIAPAAVRPQRAAGLRDAEFAGQSAPETAGERAATEVGLLARRGTVPLKGIRQLQAWLRSGALPPTIAEQRERNRPTRGSRYFVPAKLDLAFQLGIISPNLPAPLGMDWQCRGGTWMLTLRGG